MCGLVRTAQAAMPALRSDSALIAFRRKLEACNYDLRAWRQQQVRRARPHACAMPVPRMSLHASRADVLHAARQHFMRGVMHWHAWRAFA